MPREPAPVGLMFTVWVVLALVLFLLLMRR